MCGSEEAESVNHLIVECLRYTREKAEPTERINKLLGNELITAWNEKGVG